MCLRLRPCRSDKVRNVDLSIYPSIYPCYQLSASYSSMRVGMIRMSYKIVSIAVPEISICQSNRIVPRAKLVGIVEVKISIESNGRAYRTSKSEYKHMRISK